MTDMADITGAWDPRTLPPAVQVGAGCFLERRESFSRIRSGHEGALTLGDDVGVYMWTSFDLGPDARVEIGDRSVLVGVQIMCARRITIGCDVFLSHQVIVADSDFHPVDPAQRRIDAIANSPGGDRSLRPPVHARPVVIEDGAWIGIGAIVLKGVRIGAGARIGAGTVVTSDVAPGAVVGTGAR